MYDLHHGCTHFAGICRGLSPQSQSRFSTISIGRHPRRGTRPLHGQAGSSIAPENWYVGETLAGFQLQRGTEEVFSMDILAESRLTFRQGHTVQPFAMVSGKQVCRYQDMSKKAKLVATPLESFGRLRLKRSVPLSESSW